jgi:membrane protein YqaA with SNARE-associated domain
MDYAVFIEALQARLLPISSEVTLGAIRHLRLEDYPPHAALAGLGALIALAFYYAMGCWLRRAPEKFSTEAQRARIEGIRGAAREWLPWLLVLSPTPLGGMVVMAAAFFRLKLALIVAVVVASEAVFRAMPYLN